MILCQEGYRPGTKITNGLASGVLDGVIVSPRYHGPGDIASYLEDLRRQAADAYLLLDPEFHLGLVVGDKVGKLAEYPHYHDDLSWSSFTASRIGHYVDEVLSLQDGLPVSRLVSPAAVIRSLQDWQSSACLSLFDQSIGAVGQPRARESLLLTLAVGDAILSSRESVDELLNVLTIMDCRGFYLIVDRQNAEDTIWCGDGQDAALGTLLYLVRILAMNDFEVVCGYTDFAGLLMLGAGADGVASGWFKKQRLFDSGRFAPSPPGGRAPKDYYASAQLMNWIPLSPDIDILDRAGLLNTVLSDTAFDDLLGDRRREERWTLEVSVLTFWETMQHANRDLRALDARERIPYIVARLEKAEQVWHAIRDATRRGPALSVNAANIQCWGSALANFEERLTR